MLTAEIKINGSLLGHLYLQNLGSVDNKFLFEGNCRYKARYVNTGEDFQYDFEVIHNREDGAERLVELALAEVFKKKRNKNKRTKSKFND